MGKFCLEMSFNNVTFAKAFRSKKPMGFQYNMFIFKV